MDKPAGEALRSPQKYTWGGVMDFLQEQQRTMNERETEWLLEKQELQARSTSLEGELKAQENINRDLLKRIKMLEYALRQERLKYSKGPGEESLPAAVSSASIPTTVANAETMGEIPAPGKEPEVKVAKRRAQRHREMLKK